MRQILPLLVFFLSMVAGCTSDDSESPTLAPPDELIKATYGDLAYNAASQRQKLDIVLPIRGTSPYPMVLLIHGGGWFSGDKSQYRDSERMNQLLAEGYAVVLVNYRLSGEAKFPAQIHDIKGAIRFLRANAQQFSLDTHRIAVWGTSAGAHLATLVGTSADEPALEGTVGPLGPSSRVQVVIDWFGAIDLLKMNSQLQAQGCQGAMEHDAPDSRESELMGFPIQTDPATTNTASPLAYLSPNDPPMYIAHGLNDCTVPYGQSQLLYDSVLVVQGLTTATTLTLYPNTSHGDNDPSGAFAQQPATTAVLDFLKNHLK